MNLRQAAGLVSFFGAIVIGAAAAYVVNGPAELPVSDVRVSYQPMAYYAPERAVSVRAGDLRGTWTGYFGYGDTPGTIAIERVEGNVFYGTLHSDGSEVKFEGYIDPASRSVSFKETKVISSPAELGKWSLGINSGRFSADGLQLTGTGTDEWGTYRWSVRKGVN